jgi:hypothetical protein
MSTNKTFCAMVICLLSINQISFCQVSKSNKGVLRAASDLTSGNYKDVITNFFQLALNDLTSSDRRFRFSSNLFALKLKANPDADIDSNYIKNKFFINSNVDIDLKTDDNFKFKGFGFGYRYAIVNRRDITLAQDFKERFKDSLQKARLILQKMNDQITLIYSTKPDSLDIMIDALNDMWDNAKSFDKLNTPLKKILRQAIPEGVPLNDQFVLKQTAVDAYLRLVNSYKRNFLWTISTNGSTYADGFVFANLDVESQATAFMANLTPHGSLEFDIKAKLAFVDDSLSLKRDLNRTVFSIQGGFNYVLRSEGSLKPWFELKLAATYNNLFAGQYLNEEKDLFTLNGTARVRITDQFWIPFEIKYDPKNTKTFAFLGLRVNFDWGSLKDNTKK